MSDKQQQKHEQKARQAQAKAQINRDKARRKLLRQRKKLAQRRTRNRNQSETPHDDADGDDGDAVQNPVSHSTIPSQKSNAENAVRNSHTTVPKTPKYSDMPARERLYGQRLHQKTTGKNSDSPSLSDESASESNTDIETNNE